MDSPFLEWHKDAGKVKVGKKVTIEFKYDSSKIEEILGVTASCGCSIPIDVPKESLIRVDYIPQDIPKHLKSKGETSYSPVKYIYVDYEPKNSPGTILKEELVINCTVYL